METVEVEIVVVEIVDVVVVVARVLLVMESGVAGLSDVTVSWARSLST